MRVPRSLGLPILPGRVSGTLPRLPVAMLLLVTFVFLNLLSRLKKIVFKFLILIDFSTIVKSMPFWFLLNIHLFK